MGRVRGHVRDGLDGLTRAIHLPGQMAPMRVGGSCVFSTGSNPVWLGVVGNWGPGGESDWYSIAEQLAPAPHLARLEGRAALTHVCCVSGGESARQISRDLTEVMSPFSIQGCLAHEKRF